MDAAVPASASALDRPEVLVQVSNCRQSYHKESSADLVVLDDVDLTLTSGEIVGLLGRSGSGKSTLLRIVSGLLRPTSGEVSWRGVPVRGPAPGVAMVFQSFALFPWLTVQGQRRAGAGGQGRRARGARAAGRGGDRPDRARRLRRTPTRRSCPAACGSGSGLARALVVHPDLLLMDEPFSALDVLTAENLRTDLIELWSEGRLPVKAVLIVTHNIEESVLMCDRILVFSSNPGRVAHELAVPFPHPRNRHDPAFRQFVDRIYGLMTRRETPPPADPAAPQTKPPFSQALPSCR